VVILYALVSKRITDCFNLSEFITVSLNRAQKLSYSSYSYLNYPAHFNQRSIAGSLLVVLACFVTDWCCHLGIKYDYPYFWAGAFHRARAYCSASLEKTSSSLRAGGFLGLVSDPEHCNWLLSSSYDSFRCRLCQSRLTSALVSSVDLARFLNGQGRTG
jgi:hypothetical protein